MVCAHPLKGLAAFTSISVPLIAGDHVTDDAGQASSTTATRPNGREDLEADGMRREARSPWHLVSNSSTVDDARFPNNQDVPPGLGPDREGALRA